MGIGKLVLTGGAAAVGYRLLIGGGLTVDTGWGRSLRPLGPVRIKIAAPPDTVFDVIAAPYLGRTPKAMAGKLEVIERGTDLVLAAHYTPVRYGLTATTLETVRFTRPTRVDFRLVRGPVPHVVEYFDLERTRGGTMLSYGGELGADLWGLGRWWGERVGAVYEAAVRGTFDSIAAEAQRRAGTG